jgi:hypothetical protein
MMDTERALPMRSESWSAPGADEILFAVAMERMLLHDYRGRRQPFRNVCYFTEEPGAHSGPDAQTSLDVFVQWV